MHAIHYGHDWVLVAGPDAEWIVNAPPVARRMGVPLRAYRFGVDLPASDGAARFGVSQDEAVLVRPDGFVAWRGRGPVNALELALRGVLFR